MSLSPIFSLEYASSLLPRNQPRWQHNVLHPNTFSRVCSHDERLLAGEVMEKGIPASEVSSDSLAFSSKYLRSMHIIKNDYRGLRIGSRSDEQRGRSAKVIARISCRSSRRYIFHLFVFFGCRSILVSRFPPHHILFFIQEIFAPPPFSQDTAPTSSGGPLRTLELYARIKYSGVALVIAQRWSDLLVGPTISVS